MGRVLTPEFIDIRSVAKRLRTGSLTCEAVARACLNGIRELEPHLNAFITVTEEHAIATARQLDQELRSGHDRGRLHGIPVVCKDCIDTANIRTTIGSQIFRNRVPHRDAEVIRRLSRAGVVLLGKNNMNEFAAGGPGGYNKFYGATRNPWNLEHESGGSSSGTGAAVAAGLCLGGLGTDSGGSIRGPAAHMAVVGLRPTIDRVSLSGVFPRAPSLDTCGPLAPSVLDAAALFNALIDQEEVTLSADEVPTLRGLRLGVVEDYCFLGVQEDVAAAVQNALRTFVDLGARVVALEVAELLDERVLVEATRLLVHEFAREIGETYRSFSNKESFGPVVHSDLAKAEQVSERAYWAARKFKREFSTKIHAVLQSIDVLVTPAMPTTAPRASQPDLTGAHRRFTIPFSLAGVPAVSLPCGLSSSNLPIGLQLVGAPFAENRVLVIAHAYERATRESRTRPSYFCDLMDAL